MTTSAPPAILVVDDDPDTCRNLADILGDLGYRVDTAPDGPSALEKVRRAPYEIALLDFKMPGMNGLEVYREIKRLRPEMVAIIVSAYTDPGTRDAATGAGVWQVLPKPVDFPALLDLVGQAVGQPLVMVVDDDHDLCDNLWQLLRDRGFRVSLAHDARTAAERVREHEYKVVLIDMRLPDGDGSEVARTIRQESPTARTVLITGHRAELDGRVRQALREGADAVCYKPFDVPELLTTLENLAAKRQNGGGSR